MKKYNFYVTVLTEEGVSESNLKYFELLNDYCLKHPNECHREDYDGISTFQIETDNKARAAGLRLQLSETHYYPK